jgi:hypothetical protein
VRIAVSGLIIGFGLLATGGGTGVSPVAGQTVVAAVRQSTPLPGRPGPAPDSTDLRMRRTLTRSGTGAIGMVAGGAAGAAASTLFDWGHCECESAGLLEGLIGATIGAYLGTAVGSALPKLDSSCRFPARFGLALLGTGGGAAIGGLGAAGSRSGPIGTVIVGVSVPLGAAFAQWKCS